MGLLGDRERRIGIFSELKDVGGVSGVEALERLLERHERWADLIELWEGRIEKQSKKDRERSRARIAGVWLDSLGDPQNALAATKQLLNEAEDDKESCALLERIMRFGITYQAAWRQAIPRLLVFDNCEDPKLVEAWAPDVLVTQLGCDTHASDPLANGVQQCLACRMGEATQRQKGPRLLEEGAVITDEVEDDEMGLTITSSQTSTKLLQEQNLGFCWPEHQYRVDAREVNAFIKQVDGKYDAQLAFAQLSKRFDSTQWRARIDRCSIYASPAELVGHELRMAN